MRFPTYTVSSYDYERVESDLRVRALDTRMAWTRRVHTIGYRLMKAIPLEERGNQHYLGMLVSPLDEYVARLYSMEESPRDVVVFGVIKGSPAEAAGFREKDIIRMIGRKPVTIHNFDALVLRMKAGTPVAFTIERDGTQTVVSMTPEALRYNVPFLVTDDHTVNTYASPSGITVTYGMLKFVQSDDELAMVMAHELAHLVHGQILRDRGFSLLSAIISIAIGQTRIPQAGDLSLADNTIARDRFPGDFEREADRYGVLYAHTAGFDILNGMKVWERFGLEIPGSAETYIGATQPVASERRQRLQGIADEIRNANPRR